MTRKDKRCAPCLLLKSDAIAATGDVDVLDTSVREVVHFSDLHPQPSADRLPRMSSQKKGRNTGDSVKAEALMVMTDNNLISAECNQNANQNQYFSVFVLNDINHSK